MYQFLHQRLQIVKFYYTLNISYSFQFQNSAELQWYGRADVLFEVIPKTPKSRTLNLDLLVLVEMV